MPTLEIEESQPQARQSERPNNAYGIKGGRKAMTALESTLRYRLRRLVSRGGCGEVWEAIQEPIGRVVAIKKIRDDRADDPKSDREALALSFCQEAAALALLEHPSIAPVYDLEFDEDGLPRLAMKLVKGRPWDSMFREDFEKLPAPELLEKHLPILLDVALAAAFAHSKGIVHRDLKLEQVIVGEFGEAILLDWGLAILVSDEDENATPSEAFEEREEETISGPPNVPPSLFPRTPSSLDTASGFAGTPALMAPEQLEATAANVGPWTDVFLLGGMLYRLLTGKYPHESNDAFETLRRASSCEIDAPSVRSPGRDLSPELEALCLKALAKRPADRAPSAKEFAARLRDYFSGASKRRESQEILSRVRREFWESSDCYEDYAGLLSKLDRAATLWPDNPDLSILSEDIGLHCSRAALVRGDLTMAMLLAARLAKEKNREFIFSEVETRRLQEQERQRQLEERRQAVAEQAAATDELIDSLLDDLRVSLDANDPRDAALISRAAARVANHYESLDASKLPPRIGPETRQPPERRHRDSYRPESLCQRGEAGSPSPQLARGVARARQSGRGRDAFALGECAPEDGPRRGGRALGTPSRRHPASSGAPRLSR
jgi:serine/threonine protein kinase